MKNIKLFFLSLILLLSFSTGLKAEFFSDVIVTSASGIWTDSRAYSTLNAALTAVGANQRTIKIVSPQVVTNLTVPSNVTLDFERDGSITNSGQLTINTKNIRADNRQIFTGVGNIDFASGTIVQTGWFSNIETAFALTGNDTITLIVSKPQTITASYSPGNNVNLKWDSPGNILTVNTGVTVSNIGQVEAGNYQILAGAGNFRFRDGTELNLSWFPTLRAAITWISTNTVTLINNVSSTVGFTDTIPATTTLKISRGGILTVSGGVTLTVNGEFSAGPYQCFVPTGTIVLSSVEKHYPEWYSSGTYTQATIEAALTAIGTTNKATLLLRPGTWVISSTADWSASKNVTFKIVPGAVLSGAFTVTFPTNPDAGLYKIFDSTLTVAGLTAVNPKWFGATGVAGGDDNAAFTKMFAALGATGGIVTIPPGTYDKLNQTVTAKRSILVQGSGVSNTVLKGIGGSSHTLKIIGPATSWEISNLSINGNGTSAQALYLSSSNPLAGSDSGLFLFRQLVIYNANKGVQIDSVSEVTFIDVVIQTGSGASSIGLYSTGGNGVNILLIGGGISGWDKGIVTFDLVGSGNESQVNIDGVSFSGNTTYCIHSNGGTMLNVNKAFTEGSGRFLYVQSGGSGSIGGTYIADLVVSSITHADKRVIYNNSPSPLTVVNIHMSDATYKIYMNDGGSGGTFTAIGGKYVNTSPFEIAGTTRPTYIGVSGLVNNPRVKVRFGSDQSIADNTATFLAFDDEAYDTSSMHDNSTNNTRLTIPAMYPGVYLIQATVTWAANATGPREVEIWKNGALFLAGPYGPGQATVYTIQTVSTIDVVAVGDYYEVKVYQNSTVALAAKAGFTNTTFMAAMVGGL